MSTGVEGRQLDAAVRHAFGREPRRGAHQRPQFGLRLSCRKRLPRRGPGPRVNTVMRNATDQ
jgi:hypothetical protein